MEKFHLKNDIKVFYKPVNTFPLGIKEAFDELIASIGHNMEGRSFYGLSHLGDKGNIIYKSAITESYDGEGKKRGYDSITIQKGIYRAVTIPDWMSKIDKIKEAFDALLSEPYDGRHPCVEWYKSDKELLCLVKQKEGAV